MKLKFTFIAILAMLSSFAVNAANSQQVDVVLPEGVSESTFGANTVTDGTNYYATLQAATEAVAGNAGAVLYCKPSADAGSLQHAPVTATLTVYGNGASVTGFEHFDLGNTDPTGGRDITADMTLTIKSLDGFSLWGAKATAHTANVVIEDCADMGKVFISGTTGTLNITINDSEFKGRELEAVYSNADGAITLNNVAFSNLNKAINLNHKAAGTQTVTISGCSFTNCGNDVNTDQIPVRVLTSVEGGKSVLNVSNTTFSGTPEGGADILLDYGVGVTEATVTNTAANVLPKNKDNNAVMISVTANEGYSNVAPAYVATIGEQGYATLEAAFAAATEGQTITLLGDATPALTSQRAITKAAVIDLGGKTMTLTEDDLYFGTTTFKNGTIVVDPSVKPSTAVFWMFANQTLTFDNVKIVATGVTGTYLIGLDGNNSDLNLLNGSEILVENTTALDLDIICVNASTGNDINVDNSKVNVTNLDGRVFFRGNYTVKDSEVNLAGITKAGFRIEAGQTLSIEGASKVNIEGEPRDGGIHLTDVTAAYTKEETATVNATVNAPAPAYVAKIGETPYATLQAAIEAVQEGETITLIDNVVLAERITIPADKTLTIDLNGKSISMEESIIATAYAINNLGNLTITDGVGGGSINARGIYNGYGNGGANVATAKITVVNGTINAKGTNGGGAAIFNYGVADIQGGTFTSVASYAIALQTGSTMTIGEKAIITGGINSWQSTLTVNGGTISNDKSGKHVVYAGESTVAINGGTFHNNNSGNATIMASGSTAAVEITGGTFTLNTVDASSSYLIDATSSATYTISGGSFTGGIRAQGGTKYEITGGTFTNEYGNYNVYEGGDINISGGTFTGSYAQKFATDNLAAGYELGEDGKVTSSIAYVAKIGEQGYATLEAAVAAAQAGETIELIADAEVVADETVTLDGVNLSTLNGVTLTNNGTVEVTGEVSLNIETLTGEEINFLDGAIVKNSTIGGSVFVAGNVTFRGANTFAMLYDYGTLTDYYGTTAPMKWTVEEGASVTLTNAARYGLGYGDDVTVYGNIENALTARENLTDADRSLFMHGLVAQESKGWNCDSKFTVENAYVAIGSNNSFGNKSGNYGGTYTFNIKNSVVDASRITFYEASSTTTFTFDGCDVKMGTFMTRDADSKFTLKNSKVLSTTASNGTDEGNYNKGELTLENSTLTYSAEFKHEAGTINLDLNSSITAPKMSGVGTININAEGVAADVLVIKANMTGFTGAINVEGGKYEITDEGFVVKPLALEGEGTEANPYIINNVDDLVFFRNSVNAGETKYNTAGVWVALGDDIDLTSIENWEPIGTWDYSFDANFDGKGKKIINLKMSDNSAANGEADLGFFGITAYNVIKDLVIENVTVESKGQIVAAAIAYPYYTTVSDITVRGDIAIKGGNYTAGVLAYTRLCQNASNLAVVGNEGSCIEGAQVVGGVIADIQMNHGLVANYSNFSAEGVAVKGTKMVGGISGIIATQTLNGATVKNVTLSSGDSRVGTIAGAFGGTSTISNVTVENVEGATAIVGPTYDGAKPVQILEHNGVYTIKSQFLSGEGTEANPYLISNVEDLLFFRNSVNAGETKYNAEGVYVALGANIDLTGIDWSVNIGDDCNATFDGIFDGKGFTISNLTATETAQKGDVYICTGLFGAIYGNAVVKNFTLENVTIDAPFVGNNVSAVVGFAYACKGSIENVKVVGVNINAPKATGVGAIVGYDYYSPALTVKNCVVKGNDGSAIVGKSYTGGLVGYASSKIAMNNNTVEDVTVSATASVGAVAGIMLAGGSATDNTVKNVTLTATGALWANSSAVVAGTITSGAVTVSNTTVENVTANGAAARLVGGILVEKPATEIAKVQAQIGDKFYTTLQAAATAAKENETITLIADVEATEALNINCALDFNGHSLTATVAPTALPEGYAALPNLDGKFVIGAKPTATVNNLGMTTVAAGEYSIWDGSFDSNTEDDGDMPLSFVMQFLADQDAEDMATSPFADWYGDFVLTFTGLENGSFTADNCYLAGHYGSFGWVKIPVDGMVIEDGARYPVMLGVGMGQKYDYICSSVEDFKCALYLAPEILAANPNIEVKLELGVVDNSKGSDAAASALMNNDNVYSVTEYTYDALDFDPNYIAELEIIDGVNYTNDSEKTVGKLTYVRTLPAAGIWYPVFLPFDVPVDALAANFDVARINDLHTNFSEEDGSIEKMWIEYIVKKSGTLPAGKPFLVRAKNSNVLEMSIVLEDVTLYPASKKSTITVASAITEVTFEGVYASTSGLKSTPSTRYMAVNADGVWDEFDGYSLNPFRVMMTLNILEEEYYIKSAASLSVGARVIGEENEDGTTVIYDVEVDRENDGAIYDLQGRRVLETEKGGIYIMGGKKFIAQ